MQIRPTALISGLKGKLGGTVFQMNASRIYARTNARKNNPNSVNWMIQKGYFSNTSQAWKGLTDAQRASWKAVVASWPSYDKYGEPRTPSGYEIFCKVNLVVLGQNQPLITNGFIPAAITPNTAVGIATLTSSAFVVDLGVVGATGFYYAIFAAPPSSVGVLKSKPAYCFMNGIGTDVADLTSIFPIYIARFGAIPVGSRVQIKIQIMSATEGTIGNIVYFSKIAS